MRSGAGRLSTHWTAGILGMTESTRWAVDPPKTVSQDPALQKSLKFLLDEIRRRFSLGFALGQESVEIVLNYLIKQGLFWLAPLIALLRGGR